MKRALVFVLIFCLLGLFAGCGDTSQSSGANPTDASLSNRGFAADPANEAVTAEASAAPTPQPTPEPTPQPTPEPTPQPTPEPTPQPTPEPTPQPTPEPTPQPTPEPTPQPTPEPTPQPTPEPTPQPTPEPTPQPTPDPTPQPGQGTGGSGNINEKHSDVRDYVLNMNTMKFHYPNCSSVKDIKDKNRWDYTGTREEIIEMGYVPCKKCNP